MKKLKEFPAFQWIVDEKEPVDFDKWAGSRVLNLIPHRFSHYCKIMHPLHRDSKIRDEKLLWNQCDSDENAEFEVGERITFLEVAQRYNLKLYKGDQQSYPVCYPWGLSPLFAPS